MDTEPKNTHVVQVGDIVDRGVDLIPLEMNVVIKNYGFSG